MDDALHPTWPSAPDVGLDLGPTIGGYVKRSLRRLRADYRHLTGSLRGLPTVLIIGAQRSGTTSLFNYLALHPQILVPLGKEVHYFDLHYTRGLKWYRGWFPFTWRLRRACVTVDASPYYLAHPLAAQRAGQLLPEAKLIAVLRNPIERALSHHQHEVRGGRETLSFIEALDREAERLAGEEERLEHDPEYYSFSHHRYSYTRRGLYLQQLQRWTKYFHRSQLLVLQSEWMFRDPAAAMTVVLDFLGLQRQRLEVYQPFDGGKYEAELPVATRSRLAAYFEPHNTALFRWLGEEFDWN
jgi:hypothetical protein